MRLKEYGRNPKKRKAYVQQPALLLVGVDVSKAKHSACIGTQTAINCRKLEFTHTREGFRRFEQTLKDQLGQTHCRRLLIAMEPSGSYWQALYERLKSCGYGVCLVHCQAVHNNRKTMPEGTSKTDEKDAYSVFDLLLQGKFFLPVERDPELRAAYRLMQRHMALKKRVSQLRNQLRAAIHLAFPELNLLMKDLTQPTALRFLQANPTPESILRNGRTRFLDKWQPRRRCGQWRPEAFHRIYDLAKASIGLQDAYRIDEFEIKTLADDWVDTLTTQQLWLDKAIELLKHRADYQLLLQLPRIGKPTAAAILTAIGDIHEYHNGKQLVKLAGLDIRLFESGSSIRKLPKISHVGSAYLRYWLYHYALRLIAHEPHFAAYYQRRKHQSPGKGAGQRALIAVCDKTIRMVYRILIDRAPYAPKKDQRIAAYYAAQRPAA
jgi:transposase